MVGQVWGGGSRGMVEDSYRGGGYTERGEKGIRLELDGEGVI